MVGQSLRTSMHKKAPLKSSSQHSIALASSSHHSTRPPQLPSSRRTTSSTTTTTRWVVWCNRKSVVPTLCVLAFVMVCVTNVQFGALKQALLSRDDSALEISLSYPSGILMGQDGHLRRMKSETTEATKALRTAEYDALSLLHPTVRLVETVKEAMEDEVSMTTTESETTETPAATAPQPPSHPTNLTQALTCGCPDSCDEKALRYSNGHYRCETRIQFLMNQYKLSEHEACDAAASTKAYDGHPPPCDTRCVPGICKHPKVFASTAEGDTMNGKATLTAPANRTSIEEQQFDCGCPETCDDEALEATNGHHVCGERINFLMNRYHTSHMEACRIASTGDNPPCTTACQPGVCQKSSKQDETPMKKEFLVDCGCQDTCDDLAKAHGNGHFNCGQRLEFLITNHHVTEEEACIQSTEGENPPCTTECKPGVCRIPEPPLTILQERELNVTEYDPKAPPKTSLLPWSNLTTFASYTPHLASGFRNQMAAFTILILESIRAGHGQLLIESIRMKDIYGSNRNINFEEMWDVEHWNSFYPKLPRLVQSDPVLHDIYDPTAHGPRRDKQTKKWLYNNGTAIPDGVTADRPSYSIAQHMLMAGFMRYSKGKGPYVGPRTTANPADILMQKDALRPHPNLQAIIDDALASVNGNDGKPLEYMTVHARVEPDMQRHQVCRDLKVYNLTDIFRFMEEQWPEPPMSAVFMPINREMLEKEGYLNKDEPEKTNWVAVDNLRALDDALENGLWGGKVKVFRFGASVLKGTKYEQRPSVTGSMLDYFVALQGKIFVGTQISSFSHSLVTNRFHRNEMENYEYLPDGLHHWTPPGTQSPPPFDC